MGNEKRAYGFTLKHLESIAAERQIQSGNARVTVRNIPPISRITQVKKEQTPRVQNVSRPGIKAKVGAGGREGIYGYLLPHEDDHGIGFFLDGRPVAKERPRLTISWEKLRAAVLNRDFDAAKAAFAIKTPKKTILYEKRIASITKEAMGSLSVTDIDIAMRIHFTLSKRPGGRPDLDNLVKAVLDGMNAVFWVDDRQVKKIEATLEFSNEWPEGVIVMATARESCGQIETAIRNCVSKHRSSVEVST